MSRRGRYSLAPRAMMELSTFLEKEYEEEVKECPKCRRLMLAVSSLLCIIFHTDTYRESLVLNPNVYCLAPFLHCKFAKVSRRSPLPPILLRRPPQNPKTNLYAMSKTLLRDASSTNRRKSYQSNPRRMDTRSWEETEKTSNYSRRGGGGG